MRKLALLLVFLIPVFPISRIQSQESTPDYAFAYGLQGGEVRVAMMMNNDWFQSTIPARVLFGAADVELALPEWSPDGLTLYVVTYDPIEANVAVTIQAYDVLSNQLSEVLAVTTPEELDFLYEFVRVDSVSPDGNYAVASRLVNYQSLLIDLQNKAVVALMPCPSNILTWLTGEVMLACNGRLFATPNIYAVRLSDGRQTRALVPPTPDPENPLAAYIKEGLFLPDGRYLVGPINVPDATAIGLLETEEYAAAYFGTGTQLRVGENQLAFVQRNRLQRLNLDSMRQSDLGAIVGGPRWNGETLAFWRTQTTPDGLFQAVYVEASRFRREEHLIYSGPAPSDVDLSPYGPYVAATFQPQPDQSAVEIHGPEGLIWASSQEYTGYIQLQPVPDRPVAWSANGEWVHLLYAEDLSVFPRTLSVNVETGESLPAPEPQARFVRESPDGEWWLYMVISNPIENPTNRLLAYRHSEDDLRILADGLPLYENPSFPLWQYFEWSQ
ncbi:MAG: hypothetical protein F9K27_07765 [Anaerolineae bacterium]|nr:MAG: hypothetical protein F9K27_07765 [Anaerolineae bacterium]